MAYSAIQNGQKKNNNNKILKRKLLHTRTEFWKFFNIPTCSPTYDSKSLLSSGAKLIPWILDCFKYKKMWLSQGKFGPYVTIRTNMPITRPLMVPQGQLNTKGGQARRLSLEHW